MDPKTRKSSASPELGELAGPDEATLEELTTDIRRETGEDKDWSRDDPLEEEHVHEIGRLIQSGSSWGVKV